MTGVFRQLWRRERGGSRRAGLVSRGEGGGTRGRGPPPRPRSPRRGRSGARWVVRPRPRGAGSSRSRGGPYPAGRGRRRSARPDAQAADGPWRSAALVPQGAGHGVLLGLRGPVRLGADQPGVVAGGDVVPRGLRELVGAEVQPVGALGRVVVAGLALPQLQQLAVGQDVVVLGLLGEEALQLV